jgi:aldose 1-epimerase
MTTTFGTMPSGEEIVEAVIAGGDLSVSIINLGAVIRDIRLAGIKRSLVLGFDRLEDYLQYSPSFGALVGRCANRIAAGRFTLDGRTVQLSLNENERTHLHGGFNGFGHRVWRVAAANRHSVTLEVDSAHGEEGYPGNVAARCRYSVEPPSTLHIDIEAVTDAPTLVNLAQHSYFNLSGETDILSHRVTIYADEYTPVDEDRIPTGEIVPVIDTPYDFRRARPIRRKNGGLPLSYDINYAVSVARAAVPRRVARLESPTGDMTVEFASTEPGLQFYDGCMMKPIPVPGLDGRHYGLHGGCCFEPQCYPDSPNHPSFPSAVLRPDVTYRQATRYAFSRRSP